MYHVRGLVTFWAPGARMGTPIVKTCANVVGLSSNERSCSRGDSVATAADMTANWLRLSKIRARLLCYSAVSSISSCVNEFTYS